VISFGLHSRFVLFSMIQPIIFSNFELFINVPIQVFPKPIISNHILTFYCCCVEKQAEEQEKAKETEGGGLLDDDAWDDVEDVS
jgi:hypothetical protein